MPKAKTKKKKVDKKSSNSSTRETNIEKVLIENSIMLQKVMTNLAIKFDGLSSKISKLLELFEVSAKALADKDFDIGKESENSNEVTEKLDSLIEQNKIIARGLTLIHETNPQREFQQPPQREFQSSSPRPPQFPGKKPSTEVNKYQKSLSSKDEVPKP